MTLHNMRSVVMDCGRRSLADGVGVGEGGRRYRSRSRHGGEAGGHPGWEEMEIRHKGDGTYISLCNQFSEFSYNITVLIIANALKFWRGRASER